MNQRQKQILKAAILVLAYTLILYLLPALLNPAHAAPRLHKEKEYQTTWCRAHGGIAEYRLPDRTRVDCLTGDHAIEFDFADKWAEAYGQASHYARMTGRDPGIVLILERENDSRYLWKLLEIIKDHPARWTVWVITHQTK